MNYVLSEVDRSHWNFTLPLGIVTGGTALIRVLKELDKLEGANEDQTVGIHILQCAIKEPLRQIVENADEDAAGGMGGMGM